MTKTTAELAARVLERLRVTGAGETASAEDAATVSNYYATSFAELQVSDFVYWDQADIPDEAFEALSDLLAGRLGSDFGAPRPDLEASGRRRLGVLASQGATGLPVTGSYF